MIERKIVSYESARWCDTCGKPKSDRFASCSECYTIEIQTAILRSQEANSLKLQNSNEIRILGEKYSSLYDARISNLENKIDELYVLLHDKKSNAKDHKEKKMNKETLQWIKDTRIINEIDMYNLDRILGQYEKDGVMIDFCTITKYGPENDPNLIRFYIDNMDTEYMGHSNELEYAKRKANDILNKELGNIDNGNSI